jgi:hypothetical protein
MVQDDTSLAERVAHILGPSSAAAQALAHVASVKAQGGHSCVFYVKGFGWCRLLRPSAPRGRIGGRTSARQSNVHVWSMVLTDSI